MRVFWEFHPKKGANTKNSITPGNRYGEKNSSACNTLERSSEHPVISEH